MKKLFFIMTLACCIMPRAPGSPPTPYAFSAKWTPLQVIVPPLALFDEATPVYGLNLTTFGGFHSQIYGISCGMLSNCAMHTGMEVGLANGAFNSVGLMLGGVNWSVLNQGVAVGLLNVCDTDPAVWLPTSENFLQIGLFNYARNGLQIGVLNYNPDAPLPWMVLFNYSSRERQEPTIRQEHDDKEKDGK